MVFTGTTASSKNGAPGFLSAKSLRVLLCCVPWPHHRHGHRHRLRSEALLFCMAR